MVLSLFPVRNCSYLDMRSHYKKYGMEIPNRPDNKGVWIWMYVSFVEAAHTYDIATRTMRGKAKPNFLEPLLVLGDEETVATISHTSWSQTARVKKHSQSLVSIEVEPMALAPI